MPVGTSDGKFFKTELDSVYSEMDSMLDYLHEKSEGVQIKAGKYDISTDYEPSTGILSPWEQNPTKEGAENFEDMKDIFDATVAVGGKADWDKFMSLQRPSENLITDDMWDVEGKVTAVKRDIYLGYKALTDTLSKKFEDLVGPDLEEWVQVIGKDGKIAYEAPIPKGGTMSEAVKDKVPEDWMHFKTVMKPKTFEGQSLAMPVPLMAQKPVTEDTPKRSVWDKLTGNDGGERYQLWPEKMVRESIAKLGMSMDIVKGVMEGQIEPSSYQSVAALANISSHFMNVGLATAPMREGSAGVFGGLLALGKHGSREEFDKAYEAVNRLMNKENPKKVWEDTGFYVDRRDGQLKFEIADEGAELKFKPRVRGWDAKEERVFQDKLGDVFKHPTLYKYYPHLKDIPIARDEFLETKMNADALFSRPRFDAEGNLKSPAFIILGKEASEPGQHGTKVLLHEIQHWIQNTENFAFGGNPKDLTPEFPKDLLEKASKYEKEYIQLLQRSFDNLSDDEKKRLELLRETVLEKYFVQEQLNEQGRIKYRNLGGEIESRNVEERYDMYKFMETLDEEMGTKPNKPDPRPYPHDTEDVDSAGNMKYPDWSVLTGGKQLPERNLGPDIIGWGQAP